MVLLSICCRYFKLVRSLIVPLVLVLTPKGLTGGELAEPKGLTGGELAEPKGLTGGELAERRRLTCLLKAKLR
jgi:hypothetical protein